MQEVSIMTVSGSGFFNSQVIIDEQRWAGNVEIHIRSSDWYAHKHHQDKRYNAVILHVVWEHDVEVFREDETPIPVLQLNKYVDKELLLTYKQLNDKHSAWIACQDKIASVSKFTIDSWLERDIFERLEWNTKE